MRELLTNWNTSTQHSSLTTLSSLQDYLTISADGGQGGGRDEARGRLGKDTLCEGRRAGGETNRDSGAGLVIIFNWCWLTVLYHVVRSIFVAGFLLEEISILIWCIIRYWDRLNCTSSSSHIKFAQKCQDIGWMLVPGGVKTEERDSESVSVE